MSTEEKTLLKGELRYIIRKVGKTWRVFDKARGSFVYHSALTGKVVQDVAEDLAQTEADRLNVLVGLGLPEELPATSESVELNTSEAEKDSPELPELPDYGELSKEDREKYEDGLIEKVKY